MSPLRQQLDEVIGRIGTAYREPGAGDGASPVLVAHLRICMLKASM